MRFVVNLLLLAFLPNVIYSQSVTWHWQPSPMLGQTRVQGVVTSPDGSFWVNVLADYSGGFGPLSQGVAWLYHFDAQGQPLDSFSLGAHIQVTDIALAPSGKLWLVGHFNETLTLPLGSTVQGPPIGNPAGILLSYSPAVGVTVHDTLDNAFNTSSELFAVTTDDSGNVYAGGSLALNAVVRKYTDTGSRLWQHVFPQTSHSTVSDIQVANGEAHVCGYFQSRIEIGNTTYEQTYGIFRASLSASGAVLGGEGIGDVGTSIFTGRILHTPGNTYWLTETLDSLRAQGGVFAPAPNGTFALMNESVSAPPSWVRTNAQYGSSSGALLGLGSSLSQPGMGGFGPEIFVALSASGLVEWAPGQATSTPGPNAFWPVVVAFDRATGTPRLVLQGTSPSLGIAQNLCHGTTWSGETLLVFGEMDTDSLVFPGATLAKGVPGTGVQGWLVAYSETVGAPDAAAEPFTVRVYPNPSRGLTTVRWTEAVGPVTLTLLDVLGRTLQTGTARAGEWQFDTAQLPAGIYTLQAQGALHTSSHRIVVR